jgi:Tfp pilus assembly protein PilF
MAALAEPTADEQFTAAFRAWGLDVDNTPAEEAKARLKARPQAVVTEVIAALDEWASQRQADGKPEDHWQRLADLAALLDEEPGSKRRELRAILARGRLPLERALGVLSAVLRPVPISVEVPLGSDRARLRQLAEQTDPATEPVLGLLTLVRALVAAGEGARAEQLLRAAIGARPREVVLYHTLGQLLTAQRPPRWIEAVACYQAARAVRPDLGVNLATALLGSGREREGLALLARLVAETPRSPYLHFQQAYALHGNGQWDEAVAEYRQAIALDPRLAPGHNNLGAILCDHQRDYDGAIACFTTAIALNPREAWAHYNLANALKGKGRRDEAVDEYRQALALDPKSARAHTNLGSALHAKGRTDEAMAEFRQAIALDPKDGGAHNGLGRALHDKGRTDEAMAEYRRAITLDPKDAKAHHNLGNAMQDKRRWDEAIAEYRKAISLDPKYAPAYSNLGAILCDHQRDYDGAITCFQKAIALDPKNASVHYNFGNALFGKGRLDEALAEYREAIDIEPKHAPAHSAIVQALLRQGRYAAAREATRRALELVPADAPLRRTLPPQLRQFDYLLALDSKLSAVLTGEAAPANPGEAVVMARMCQEHKKCYAASARLYADAFATEPRLAGDLNRQLRYNAARSAALAAAGQGADARRLPDRALSMFRRWALAWMRDDLKAYTRLTGQNNAAVKQAVRQRLRHWQTDTDLASVRDRPALDRLPENERAAWQALWRDVEQLAKRLAKKDN